ncbi:uncharacterized protein E5676_scaffold129G00460 [Cucumis melo var. makuwa]|uniref:Uncharacterized protein n=1 Tax=Cucumis melo var. makuwa TaxID=1194695 RepID=A0A5D3E0T3_CUCMM|nr:uncharacterized protein E6C27_scaffold110G001610 [Cucumis melo var. makuwa]TYK29338.1 uncharacterized protein E5676_scaffold129G00460 [Cucumis melo var. makuwa]
MIGSIEILKENFTSPLTKIEKGEAKRLEKKGLEACLPERRIVEGFDPKTYKLMANAGYDFTTRTELKSVKIFGERPELFPTQKKLQKQGYSIPNSRAGVEYQSSKPVRIADNEPKDEVNVAGCCHVTIEETSDHDIFEEDAESASLSLEDGGQSTIDELKEVNFGMKEEPRATFISVQISDDDENKYVNLLKTDKDVFAWLYKEMPGLDPKVAIHCLAIKLEH